MSYRPLIIGSIVSAVLWVIIIAVVMMIALPANSAVKRCFTTAWLTAEVNRVVPGSIIASMDQGFLDRLNAAPPRSDFRADQIMTAVHPVSDRVLVALFVKGCLNESLVIKRKTFLRLVGDGTGQEI